MTSAFLLTEAAADFFAARGFRRIAREEAAPAVRGSLEFRALCCQSAVCMRLDFRGARTPRPAITLASRRLTNPARLC